MERTWSGRVAPAGLVAAVNLAAFDLVPPTVGLPLILLAFVVAWRYTPGFWRLVLGGLVGGLIAGVLILGPGLRVAMRAVAIVDPARTPEFTLGGTAFIVVGVGAMLGGIQALTLNLLRPLLWLRSSLSGGMALGAVTLVLLFLVPGDIRSELFELGAGPLMNIPMFGGICMAYGLAAVALADKVSARGRSQQGAGAESVAVFAYGKDADDLVGG